MTEYFLHNNGVVRSTAECPGAGVYCRPRQVLVIDPEDRGQARCIAQSLDDQFAAHGMASHGTPDEEIVDFVQTALRSLVAPSKPAEPIGFGAVVEDVCGRRWIRDGMTADGGPWFYGPPPRGEGWERREYPAIEVVRVLQEGVA
jgi:hypothetical protein